jgi:hypothetical protein
MSALPRWPSAIEGEAIMSPAENARLLDLKEFAEDCAAARQRAYALLTERREQDRDAVRRCIGRTNVLPSETPIVVAERPITVKPAKVKRKPGIVAQLYTINGVSMTRREWAESVGITASALAIRVHRLGSLEAALAAGPRTSIHVVIARISSAFRRERNTQLIHRISTAFRTGSPQPPGYMQTSTNSQGTGVGRRVHDLQQNLEKSR